MNSKNESDLLFERYLSSQGFTFDYEPEIPKSNRRIDYVVGHPSGPLYFEVKQIEVPLPGGSFFQWDPYPPIRSHIHDAVKQFQDLPNSINALVFAAGPCSFVDLRASYVMLGAMYGDFVFHVPLKVDPKNREDEEVVAGFMPGKGKMVRRHHVQNTRISAIISLHDYNTFPKEAALYLKSDDGRTLEERQADLWSGQAEISEELTPCVTVWENAYAKRKFPNELFRGPMDARWSVENGAQVLELCGREATSSENR